MLGVTFESCPVCTGVWLDAGELTSLTRSRGGESLEVIVQENTRTEYLCPACKPAVLLHEGSHSLAPDFLLDICHQCRGLWFDRGEFPSLLKRG
jgi:Zn-finger nucleic acid-binding protein